MELYDNINGQLEWTIVFSYIVLYELFKVWRHAIKAWKNLPKAIFSSG